MRLILTPMKSVKPTTDHLTLETPNGETPLAYVRQDDIIYLISSGYEARWPSHILRQRKAAISIKGSRLEADARLVTDQNERDAIIRKFTDKYSQSEVSAWYSGYSRIIKLNLAGQITGRGDDSNYYDWLESEFDSIAYEYDRHIFGNTINTMLRERSLALMARTFVKSGKLLEIGSGSGTETIELLKAGHEIVSIDISSKMLEVLESKARVNGVETGLQTLKLRASELEKVLDQFGDHYFDGIYSTYGALNCEPDINFLPEMARRALKPGGKMVVGIYNKLCAFEIAVYLFRFKIRNAFFRLHSMIPEGKSRFCVDTYAYTLPHILSLFDRYFTVESVEGLPVLIPPSNFVKYMNKFNRKFDTLKDIDRKIGKIWPMTMLGDHFLVSFVLNEK